MTANCPTCRQPVEPIDVYVDADRRVAVRNDEAAVLSGREFDLFEILLRRYPRVVEFETLYGHLYDDRGDDQLWPAASIVTVLLHKLRVKLAPLGLKVKPAWKGRPPTKGDRSGYSLEKVT